MNGKLPPGWEMATLDDLGTWTGGGTPSKKVADYWGGDIPWVTPKDMKAPRLNGSQDRITAKAVQESSAKLVPAGSLAFVVRSGILEHTLPIALLKCDATINQDLKVLTPHADLNPEWLLYALLALAPMIRRECRKDGTTVASLDFPKLRRYPVPLPPRAEQDRIVEAVESVMAAVDEALRSIHRAHKTMELLEELNAPRIQANVLRRAILHRAFTGQLVPQDPADEPASELLKRIEAEKAEREAELKAARRRTRKDRSGSSAETAEALPRPPSQSGKVGTSSD